MNDKLVEAIVSQVCEDYPGLLKIIEKALISNDFSEFQNALNQYRNNKSRKPAIHLVK